MSSPITEVVTFTGTDGLKADPDLFHKVKYTQVLAKKITDAGMIEQAWGVRVEEPGVWQGFLDWPTIEHHKKAFLLLKDDAEFADLVKVVMGGAPEIIHVPFAPFDNYKKCMAAPLTEIVFFQRKDDADVQEVKNAIEYGLDTAAGTEGCVRGAWGFSVEDERAAVVVIGWESHEAHQTYEATQGIKDVTAKLLKVGTIEHLVHIRFQ